MNKTGSSPPFLIIGAGLAGCTLAWQLYFRGVPFRLLERPDSHGSSRVAPGLLSPVAGKSFNPSWRIDTFLPPMQSFYARVESQLGTPIWIDLPVHRLFASSEDRTKFEQKRDRLAPWIAGQSLPTTTLYQAPYGGVYWRESGRLDLRTYLRASCHFFAQRECFEYYHWDPSDALTSSATLLYTCGAQGLLTGQPIALEHRCAKGEILTVHLPGLPEDQILSRAGWLVPTGLEPGTFYAGADYQRADLTINPTPEGQARVAQIIASLTSLPFTVLQHEAALRPIVRRSEPLIGRVKEGQYLFNALGSKGVLYAPHAAANLVDHLLGGTLLDPELDLSQILLP